MLIWILAGLVLLVVAFLVNGVLHFRRSARTAWEAVGKVELDEVGPLRAECEAVFREKFQQELSLERFEASAKLLSDRLDDVHSLKNAFQKPDFYWYFVLPVGAWMGEFLRAHAHGEWQAREEGGLQMEVRPNGQVLTTFPFEKVLKQVETGGKGDIYAYLLVATGRVSPLDQNPPRQETC